MVVKRKNNCMFTVIVMVSLLLSVALSSTGASAVNGLNAQDPMVKISSLPIDKNKDEVLAAISKDVSRDTGIEQEYITYYWQTLDAVNCMGKKTTNYPILVDLYVPGFFDNKKIGSMMTSLAAALERNVGIDRKWVFVQAHFPNQAQVYLSGEVQVWDDYKGSENAAEYEKPKSHQV